MNLSEPFSKHQQQKKWISSVNLENSSVLPHCAEFLWEGCISIHNGLEKPDDVCGFHVYCDILNSRLIKNRFKTIQNTFVKLINEKISERKSGENEMRKNFMLISLWLTLVNHVLISSNVALLWCELIRDPVKGVDFKTSWDEDFEILISFRHISRRKSFSLSLYRINKSLLTTVRRLHDVEIKFI